MSSLRGRRVLVTRPREQTGTFVAALEAAGAIPVIVPLIAFTAPDDPAPAEAVLDRVEQFDWLVLTSGQAARCFGERWSRRGHPLPVPPRVVAIGPRTASVARRMGITVHAQPEEFRGEAIPVALGDVRGRAVLLPRSDIGREATAAALRVAGARVQEVVFYRTIPAPRDEDAERELRRGVDVLTFMSPSAVNAFVTRFGPEVAEIAGGRVVACIGPVTAAAARAAGLVVQVQPSTYTGEALVRALEAAC